MTADPLTIQREALRLTDDAAEGVASRVIAWQRKHGRHGLPWQDTRDPYRVWLSEIMLQQTQVGTVLDYYARFLQRFPDVARLAAASVDDVLALWSGLGYYSRARHLHRCAQQVMVQHGGRFPESAEALMSLPGIGRSTAAAIAAFCFGERVAILDGNVKRVLTRLLAFDGDIGQPAVERGLWTRAQDLLPTRDLKRNMPAYTQGLMDLGATVCTRRRPLCMVCPLVEICQAARAGDPERYPVKLRRLRRTEQALWLLHAVDGRGRVWLQQRPHRGIWAGLHCLPTFDSRDELLASLTASAQAHIVEHTPFLHVLTHRDLHLHVISVRVAAAAMHATTDTVGAWRSAEDLGSIGLPAPVKRFLLAHEK